MPNGYAEAMRIFTKIRKPPFSFLREKGFSSVVFVDDTYLQGCTYEECYHNVVETVTLLHSLGFTIHAKKSVLTPTQTIEFLGFIIDSRSMTVGLSGENRDKKCPKLRDFRAKVTTRIRELASILGSLVSSFLAVPMGRLFYRQLERFKIKQLTLAKGNFEAKLASLPLGGFEEINWWNEALTYASSKIRMPPVDCIIKTDASLRGH